MTRYAAMMLGALLSVVPPALADDKPKTDKPKKKRKSKRTADKKKLGKAYTLNFDRPYKAGQRFLVAGSASRTIRALQPRDAKKRKRNAATTDAADAKERDRRNAKRRKTLPKGTTRTAIAIRGELEIVKVNKTGDPVQVRLTIHNFNGTQTRVKGSSASAESILFRKGDIVLIGRSGKDNPKFSVKNRQIKVSKKIADLFDGIVPIDDAQEKDKQLEDLISGKQNRRVGESWKLDAKRLPAILRDAKQVSASAKFAGVKTVGKDKTKCFDVRVTIKARDIATDGKLSKSMASAKATAMLPVDSKSPPLKVSASFTIRGQRSGEKSKTADATATSAGKRKGERKDRKSAGKTGRFEMTHKYQRELRPLD